MDSTGQFPVIRYMDEQGNTEVIVQAVSKGSSMYQATICISNDIKWILQRVEDCLNGINQTIPT